MFFIFSRALKIPLNIFQTTEKYDGNDWSSGPDLPEKSFGLCAVQVYIFFTQTSKNASFLKLFLVTDRLPGDRHDAWREVSVLQRKIQRKFADVPFRMNINCHAIDAEKSTEFLSRSPLESTVIENTSILRWPKKKTQSNFFRTGFFAQEEALFFRIVLLKQ